jgi:PAS domain S-box-containing protein
VKLETPGPFEARSREREQPRTHRTLLRMLDELRSDRDALRSARREWVETVDAITDPLMVHDADFRIVRANKAYARLAGAEFTAIAGRPYWECFPRRDGPLPGCRPGLADAAAGGCRARAEEFTLDDGEVYESRIFALHNPGTDRPDSLHLFRNVTQQRRADERLKLAGLFVENSLSVVLHCAAAPGWPITYMSANVAEWGFDAKALVDGKAAFADLVHPVDLPRLGEVVESNTRRRNDSFSADFRILAKDAGIRWVEGRCFVERDAHGDPAFYKGTVTDITERKRAEMALQESKQRLRVIFDCVTDGILVASAQTRRVVMSNPAGARLFGYSATEVVGITIADVVPPDRPEVLEEFERHARGEKTFSQDVPMRRRDGSLFYADISTGLLTIDGKPHVVGIFRDVTERRRAGDELRGMIERFDLAARAAGLGVWDWDVIEDRLVWDEQMYRLYGVDRRTFTGAFDAWAKGLHPDDATAARAQVEHALRGEKEFDSEFRIVWPDGTVRHLKAHARVTRDARGEPLRMTGINYDITERKRAEEAMAAQLDELQRWQGLNLDREERVLELKREVNALLARLNEPARYPSAE